MRIKASVFGSDNEKELFKTLKSNWSNKFDLWPNLPFTNIIDTGNRQLSAKEEEFMKTFAEYLWPNLPSKKINEKINDIANPRLSAKEEKFIYKTSVDYTLCKKDGKPLLSIEFDGLGHGFSKGGEYIQIAPTEDTYRKLKLDLKLRIAEGIGYPLFVVSYDEKEPISPDVNLTIVDGLIGHVLAAKATHVTLMNAVQEDEEKLATLPENERVDYVDSLLMEIEHDADLKWNPIKSLAKEYEAQAIAKGLIDPDGGFMDVFDRQAYENSKPSPNIIIPEPTKIIIQDRKENEKENVRCCHCVLKTRFEEVQRKVQVRDIAGVGMLLAEEIAELLAFRRVLDLYGKRG